MRDSVWRTENSPGHLADAQSAPTMLRVHLLRIWFHSVEVHSLHFSMTCSCMYDNYERSALGRGHESTWKPGKFSEWDSKRSSSCSRIPRSSGQETSCHGAAALGFPGSPGSSCGSWLAGEPPPLAWPQSCRDAQVIRAWGWSALASGPRDTAIRTHGGGGSPLLLGAQGAGVRPGDRVG